MSMQVPYATSKAGVIGMMFNLRWELAEKGVGATVLCPGGVVTNIFAAESYRPSRFGGAKDANITAPPKDLKFAAPMGSPRQPDEVAQMTLAAVRQNRAVVMTDPTMRDCFMRTYVDEVVTAFDDADAFDAANARAS
jgi:NAD(P)-dependent dehydrogenase (short-subunit alcohol dehydrogenase family)